MTNAIGEAAYVGVGGQGPYGFGAGSQPGTGTFNMGPQQLQQMYQPGMQNLGPHEQQWMRQHGPGMLLNPQWTPQHHLINHQQAEQHLRQMHAQMGQNMSDKDIAGDINNLLDSMLMTRHSDVHASVHNHVVTLSGTVKNSQTKTAAEQLAWSTPGVHDVHDNIQVKSYAQQHARQQSLR